MSKSLIYTDLATDTTVADGGTIPLGSTVHRFGRNLKQDGNAIKTCGLGYYVVTAIVTFDAAAAAPVSIQVNKDGVPIDGAFSTVTVAGTSDTTVLPVQAVVRNECDCSSAISFTANGAGITVVNMNVIVEKK